MSNSTIAVIRGKLNYAKVLGDPVGNPFDDNKNWTFDLILTPDGVKEAKALGIADRIKRREDYLEGQPFLSFRHAELRKDGTPNKPLSVVDIKGQAWNQETLIGNLSDADVKFAVADFGKGKKKGMYPRSIRVLKLVPYGGKQEFDDIDEDDEFFNEAQAATTVDADRAEREDKQFKKDFSLDDDIDDVL